MPSIYKSKKEAVQLLLKDQPKDGTSPQAMTFAVDYLSFFGYLGIYLLRNLTAEDLKAAVKLFQRTFGLKADGLAGPKTISAMHYPRCGCPDFVDKEKPEHIEYMQLKERAKENQQKWLKDELVYLVDGYVTGIARKVQDEIISQAVKSWTDVAGIQIRKCSHKQKKNADIIISVGKGKDHNFDGQGGTLAWAYLPRGKNRQLLMKFDLSEIWVKDQYGRGIWMLPVAAHEFGHILGLDHSNKKEALMAPYYNPFVSSPQANDDVTKIQGLYGKPRNAAAITKHLGRSIVLRSGEELLVTCE